jgi:hypothetical protein
MSDMIKSRIPILLAGIVGSLFIIEYFVTFTPLNNSIGTLNTWVLILTSESIIIAVITFLIRYTKIARTSSTKGDFEGILTSITAIVCFGIAVYTGLAYGTSSQVFRRWYTMLFPPSHATMWALNAFFLASASYRAFKARTVESALLLLCAGITMMSMAPAGYLVWSGFAPLADFLNASFNKASSRAIAIGGAIGVISIGLRIIFGYETSYLGEAGGED